MKKLNYIISLFLLSVVCLSSCNDDDDNFTLAEFEGTWQLDSSTDPDFVSCSDNPPMLVISSNQIEFPATDQDGCDSGSITFDHSFNGSSFTVTLFEIDVTYTITSQSDSKFTWEESLTGYKETYVR